jgi:ankyrin repeat protein
MRTRETEGIAIFAAVDMGDLAKLRELIENGAKVDAVNVDGETALHMAVHARPRGEALTILLAAGADPNVVSSSGTPLYWATRWGKFDFMRQLVDAGAGASHEPWAGADLAKFVTPFQDALDRGSEEMAWFLFEKFGEDPNQKMASGRSLDDLLANKPEKLAILRAMRVDHAVRNSGGIEPASEGVSSKRQRSCGPL